MELNLYFPIFIPFENKKVLIYGGGKIAVRRVKTLLEFGANITVIAPTVEEELKCEKRIVWKKDSYKEGSIESDVFCVIAITDDSNVNETIYKECKAKNIMVNNASNKEQCDFLFPAIIKEGQVVAGLTASGTNHKLVRKVASRLREIFGQIIEESE